MNYPHQWLQTNSSPQHFHKNWASSKRSFYISQRLRLATKEVILVYLNKLRLTTKEVFVFSNHRAGSKLHVIHRPNNKTLTSMWDYEVDNTSWLCVLVGFLVYLNKLRLTTKDVFLFYLLAIKVSHQRSLFSLS